MQAKTGMALVDFRPSFHLAPKDATAEEPSTRCHYEADPDYVPTPEKA